MNWAPARIGARELHDVYLHPFEAAVRDAGLRSRDERLQRGRRHAVRRRPRAPDASCSAEQWGFDGCVVSDYFAVRQLETYHRLAADAADAAATALDGRDRRRASEHRLLRRAAARRPSRRGLVAEDDLDDAVRRVLRDEVRARPVRAAVRRRRGGRRRGRHADAQRALARTIARKSLVLLKNDGTLPLAAGRAAVAVIGPNADEAPPPLRRLHATPRTSSRCTRCSRPGENVFSIASPDGSSSARTMLGGADDRRRAARSGSGPSVRFARGCDVNSDVARRASTRPSRSPPRPTSRSW